MRPEAGASSRMQSHCEGQCLLGQQEAIASSLSAINPQAVSTRPGAQARVPACPPHRTHLSGSRGRPSPELLATISQKRF
jgi:hypothetical protein